MSDLYKALFAYETDKEDELALSVGETIYVTNKNNADWWLAERLDHKDFGLVPSNFLEQVKTQQGIVLAIVKEDYTPEDENELLLQRNDVITVLEQQPDGLWKGDLNGKKGVFPSKYVQLLDDENTGNDTKSKNGFKLAAYGVKQGGIGSILAGGFNTKRRSSTRSSSMDNTVSKQDISKPSPPQAPTTPKGKKAMVTHDYDAQNEDEIKLLRGEYLTDVEPTESEGWWKGTSESGKIGVFPSNFVQTLEDEAPPQRPARTRPATVKPETAANTETAACPPPVPVITRPTSLLSNRQGSSSSGASLSKIATAPPRPITSPPIPSPAQRPATVITASPQKPSVHKRAPSVPLVSPDLPPISPISPTSYERPTRPLPRPTSTNSTDGGSTSTSSLERSHTLNMAKPPKVGMNKLNLTAPPRPSSINERKLPTAPTSSPSTPLPTSPALSVSSTNDNMTARPRRAMPPLPQLSNIVPFDDDDDIMQSPTVHLEPEEITMKPDESGIDIKIKALIQNEIEQLRKEFTLKLEEERNERIKLEMELNKLKKA
ncbi:SH3-domain-containing protein [Backusella circina FSU 941]|nr:SH3-domain-containing protein [Backusella circina FSU 941]